MSGVSPRDVARSYPPRGLLRQYRLVTSATFHCFSCGVSKTSRLITTYKGCWDSLLCNGCYGRLLAVHQIKSGGLPDEERAQRMAQVLEGEVDEDVARQAARRIAAHNMSTLAVSPVATRFLGTSEVVGERLRHTPELDWSPAILGLCKAFEVELIRQVIDPLRRSLDGRDLDEDVSDPELRMVARLLLWPSRSSAGDRDGLSLGRHGCLQPYPCSP